MNHVQHVDWGLIAPVICPALAAMLILVIDAVLPRSVLARHGRLVLDVICGAGLLTAIVAVLRLSGKALATFCVQGPDPGCSYAVEPITTGLQLVVLVGAVVCLLLAIGQRTSPPRAEHHLLFLAATAGAVAVAGSRDLATLLVALETASLPVVGLVALRGDDRGAEAGVKLLLTSIMSVALMVLGIGMLYAATGSLHLSALGYGTLQPITPDARALAGLGLFFTVAGIAFKLSIVPFQLWTPDTYAGAPLPVAAFLAVVSKAAGLGALVVLLAAGADVVGASWPLVIGGLAAITMTVGNLVAMRQDGAVRLLAWSTVAQAGWVIMPLAGAGLVEGYARPTAGAAIAYLAAYVVASLLAFAVVAVVAREALDGERHELSAYAGLARRRPVLGGALVLALLALAGLPPGVLGLVAKVVALRPVVADQFWLVAAVAVVNVVLGIVVYLRWAVILLSPAGSDPPPLRTGPAALVAPAERVALGLSLVAAVVLSVAPQVIARFTVGL